MCIPLLDSPLTSSHEAASLGATEEDYCTPDNSSKKKFQEFQEYVRLDDIKPLQRSVWFGVAMLCTSQPQFTRVRVLVLR